MKVEYMLHMGDDLFVANVARVSFAKEKEVFEQDDERIIKYLARENHWSPFGHPQITLRVKAPIPIRTQCFKSKVGFVENEESRRYITTTPEVYTPEVFRGLPEGSIKQGSGGPHPESHFYKYDYKHVAGQSIKLYNAMIEDGVCPEQARFVLPQGCMVNWIWTGSLQAYSRFCNLRKDSHAQKEVQLVASMVSAIIEPLFPVSWKALMQ
jgi:thymidylate synthase (FAD)